MSRKAIPSSDRRSPTALARQIPKNLSVRPATLVDIPAVVDLCNACDREVIGRDSFQPVEFEGQWTMPGFELEADTVLVHGGDGRPVAMAYLRHPAPFVLAHLCARVHPEHRGQRIGWALLEWAHHRAMQRVGLAPDGTLVNLQSWTHAGDVAAEHLLSEFGLSQSRHFFKMARDLSEPVPEPTWPEGVELRPFVEDHHRPVHASFREAFRDHWGHVDLPLDEAYRRWRHWLDVDPDIDTGLWFVAWDGDEIAGMSLCYPRADDDPEMGWVMILGVRRPWRGRGLGLALLHHSFRRFRELGRPRVGLGVDGENLTGALRLYRRAGMTVDLRYSNFELVLREGRDITVQALGDCAG